jgi:hypothetical protein
MSHKIHRDGNVLYLSVEGNDISARKGDRERPWKTLDVCRDAAIDGDTIYILNGSYELTATNGTVLQDQLAIDGGKINVYCDPYVNLLADGVTVPFGSGKYDTYATPNTTFNLLGYSNITYDVAGVDIAIPFYGTDSVRIEIDTLTLLGGWGFQGVSKDSIVKVNTVINSGEGIVFSLTGATEYSDVYSTFIVKHIKSSNVTRHGIIRWQPGQFAYDGMYGKYNIGSIFIESSGRGGISLQSDLGGFDGSAFFTIDSIISERESVAVVPRYTGTSTAAGEAEPEIGYAGGASDPNFRFHSTVIANYIRTPNPTLSMQGFIISDDSLVHINIKSAISENYYCIGFFDFECLNNSKVVIEGNYKSHSTLHPCVMLNQNQFGDGTGRFIFKNCRFESTQNGIEVISIGASFNHEEIIFQDCIFINDGITPCIATNNVTPINVRMINCYTNSIGALVNIVDVLSGLTMDTNVI